MSDAAGSEVGTYCRALATHVEQFVRQHWDWQGLPLKHFERLNAGLLAQARYQAEPAGCRLLSLPPGATDEVNWPYVATLDAFLRTQKAAVAPATPALSSLKAGELVYCDATNGTGWVAEVSQHNGDKLKVTGLLEPRREVSASACRRIVHNPYAGKNITGFYADKFLEWQQRIREGVAQGRRILRQAQGFVQPNGVLAIIVTDTRPKTLEKLFGELPFLPAAYGIQTKDVCLALPFAPRILLADSVEAAHQLRRKVREGSPNASVPHLYVAGQARFKKHLAELRNEYALGEWASVTLLGNEPEDAAADYVRWRWSAEELDYYFGRHRPAEAPDKVRLKLTAVRTTEPAGAAPTDGVARLQVAVAGVLTHLNTLAAGNPAVKPRPAYHFLNAYLRHSLPPGRECARAAAWLQRQHERIGAYLAGEEAENEQLGEQFADAFYEAGIFSGSRIRQAASDLQASFQVVHDLFQEESPKHRHLTSSLKKSYHDNPAGGRYVLADRDTYEDVLATYHDNERQVSVLRLHDNTGGKPSFQQIARSTDFNAAQAQFLVPFVFNREQYELMSRAQGQVKLFLYGQLEEGKYDNVRQATERRDEARLLEASRTHFCGVSYAEMVAAGRRNVSVQSTSSAAGAAKPLFGELRTADFFAQLYALDEVGYARETQDRLVESRPYLVRFTNGENMVQEGSKQVLRLEDGGYVRRPVSALAARDEILFYENEDPRLNYTILLAQDKSGTMARIEQYSRAWQRTLRRLAQGSPSEYALHHKLKAKGLSVAILSLKQYLEGTIRFPKHEATLRAIRELARETQLPDCDLCQEEEYRALLLYRAKYQVLAKTLGRGLSDELLRYRVTSQRGPLLAALDEALVTTLSRSIKSLTVDAAHPTVR